MCHKKSRGAKKGRKVARQNGKTGEGQLSGMLLCVVRLFPADLHHKIVARDFFPTLFLALTFKKASGWEKKFRFPSSLDPRSRILSGLILPDHSLNLEAFFVFFPCRNYARKTREGEKVRMEIVKPDGTNISN